MRWWTIIPIPPLGFWRKNFFLSLPSNIIPLSCCCCSRIMKKKKKMMMPFHSPRLESNLWHAASSSSSSNCCCKRREWKRREAQLLHIVKSQKKNAQQNSGCSCQMVRGERREREWNIESVRAAASFSFCSLWQGFANWWWWRWASLNAPAFFIIIIIMIWRNPKNEQNGESQSERMMPGVHTPLAHSAAGSREKEKFKGWQEVNTDWKNALILWYIWIPAIFFFSSFPSAAESRWWGRGNVCLTSGLVQETWILPNDSGSNRRHSSSISRRFRKNCCESVAQ